MPADILIYHNPKCRKSREALDYIREHGQEPTVIDYIKQPLTETQIRKLLKILGIAPSSMIRASDFRRLELEPTNDPDKLIAMLIEHPVLMERPIVVIGDEAVIARPIERLYNFVP
jgi:arsenate reductase (glutaredoxin)